MRILYLNTTYSGGGAERVARQIYDGMKVRGHEVYEIVCYNQRGEIADPHVQVLYSSVPGKILQRLQTRNRDNESLTIPYALRLIRRFIREKRIDVVHLHNPHDSFLGIRDISAIRELCPVVWTLHDFWALTGHCAFPFGCDGRWESGCRKCERLENYPRLRRDVCGDLYQQKEKALSGIGIQYVVPSEWMESQVRKSYLREESCQVICNSLDTQIWRSLDKGKLREKYGIRTDKLILAFVAADMKIPWKGMKLLASVLEKLDERNYLLLVAGSCTEELKALTQRFELHDFGYIHDQEKMNEFYSLADLMVNPSAYETFGLVNIEAMACGTPVLAFDVCAMSEVIDESVGWCVPEVSAEALGGRIEYLECHREELLAKAAACHDYVKEKYDEQAMLDQYERLYEEIRSRSSED